MSNQVEIPFQQVIEALLDDQTILNPRYLYRLSDLEGADLLELRSRWPEISLRRRQALMEDLETLSEGDFLLSFEAISRLALEDSDPGVRLPALRILWEYDPTDLIPHLLELCVADPSPEVRASSATLLGKFVYLGEVDELPASKQQAIEEQLIRLIESDDQPLVRRRALEALAFSSREEVTPLIQVASQDHDEEWVASALFAMGRSLDGRWEEFVCSMLTHELAAIRLEAARAAGELELSTAVPALLDMLSDEDDGVRAAAIWSLSQIGGRGVRAALEELLEMTDDEEEADILETALDNLAFTEGHEGFALFDFSEEDLNNLLSQFDTEDSID